MIEINPAFKEQGMGDELNMIDARWIDMGSGLYIDVTTVRVDEKARKEGVVGALGCKDRHSYVVCWWKAYGVFSVYSRSMWLY